MYPKTKTGINGKKIYILGLALFCGLLLLSVDDCEGLTLAEQEQYARAMAERSKNDKTLAARMEQEEAMQRALRAESDAENAERIKAEQESFAARNRTRQEAAQREAERTASTQRAQAAAAATAASSASQTTAGTPATETQTAGRTPASAAAETTTSGTAAASPASAAQTGSSGANYVSSIAGKTWKLTELRFIDKTVALNRGELSGADADIFTLTVESERLGGKGAANRYFTAYQAGANNALTIRPIASTMMAAILANPQRIREPDYFQYLAKVKSWKLNQNTLELNSLDKANKELVMVFSN